VPSSAYHRWGIGITDENRQWLMEKSEFYYLKDVDDREANPRLVALQKNGQRTWLETSMASHMAQIVTEIIKSLGDSREMISVCELPAGDCKVSKEVASGLQGDSEEKSILDSVYFHLVDYSHANLSSVKRQMAFHRIMFATHGMTDGEFLDKEPEGSLDIVVSLSHLHHKSFPDFLGKVHRALSDEGVFVIGDWHSAIWDHPVNAYKLLKRIGTDEATLKRFMQHVGQDLIMSAGPRPNLRDEEWQAITDHFAYWDDVARMVKGAGEPTRLQRLHFLDASDTSEARRQKLRSAGFTDDMEKIRTAFPGAKLVDYPKRMLNNSDQSVVMVFLKEKRPRG